MHCVIIMTDDETGGCDDIPAARGAGSGGRAARAGQAGLQCGRLGGGEQRSQRPTAHTRVGETALGWTANYAGVTGCKSERQATEISFCHCRNANIN